VKNDEVIGDIQLRVTAMKPFFFENAGWNFEGILKNLFLEDGIGKDYLSFAKSS